MAERLIIVTAPPEHRDAVEHLRGEDGVLDCQSYLDDATPPRLAVHLTVGETARQTVLDRLQAILSGSADWRLTILPVEASVPRSEPEPEPAPDTPARRRARLVAASREELYAEVSRSARPDSGFMLFVALSTIVAAIGLIEDNVAVVIGAMVIAPLLGPMLAFSLGVALGDRALMGQAALTAGAGIALVIAIGFAIGIIWPVDPRSEELLARTRVGFDGMALALASGAAAALSLASGAAAALVGVMVAVALMPPAVTIGLMLGAQHPELAGGAALLLAVNVVCVNLAAQVGFVGKGIRPRTWFEQRTARRAVRLNAAIWAGLLLALAALLALRTPQV